ncbi:hypothetical protein ACWCP6_28460 [Streptomyces sp. NPDC002004]
MNPHPPRSPRLLLISTALLAISGVVLLSMRPVPAPSAPAAQTPVSAKPNPSQGGAHAGGAEAVASPVPATASALPPHGEGVAGDRAIQKALEAAWPADLAARDQQRLVAAGSDLLRADATGMDRAKWPGIFGKVHATAPAYSRFRIQAAIARRDGPDDRAVVHLVWAGADHGGTYTDGRITDWHFTRTTSKKEGGSPWTPQPRT